MKNKNKHNVIITVFIVISVMVIALMFLFALDFVKKYKKTESDAAMLESILAEKESLEDDKAKLEESVEQFEKELADIRSSLSLKDEEIEKFKNQYISDNEILNGLSEKIEQLELENSEKQLLIDSYASLLGSNTGYRTDLVTELMILLLKDAPMRLVEKEGQEEIPEEEREYVEKYPTLSYYYLDLTTGYKISYNSDEIMYAASLIKVPYIFAVLREIQEFEEKKHDFDSAGNPLYDDDGEPLFNGAHPNYDENGNIIYLPGEEKYDLSRIWKLDKSIMMEDGSGEIQFMDDGTELTWAELFKYVLLCSDNIAFKQIRECFGYDSFYTMVGELGIKGTSTGFMNLSSSDCIVFLNELYDFFEDGGKYAVMMKKLMIESKHTVMISQGYPVGTVAHKYGWDIDAYHDMAVIYDDRPYALVIMTDLDTGGESVNSYIRKIVELTKRIHESCFYTADE